MIARVIIMTLSMAICLRTDEVQPPAKQGAELIASDDKPRMANIDYVGSGYDIYFGNPHATESVQSIDPGYRSNVFDMGASAEKLTADKRFKVPSHTAVLQCLSCKLTFKSSEISSVDDYAKSLSVAVDIKASSGLSSFSASADYKSVEQEITTNENTIVESTASCTTYCASINFFVSPPLTDDFAAAVAMLPTKYDPNNTIFEEFFDNFGTHVASAVQFGGIYGERSSVCSRGVSKMRKMGIDISAAASYSAMASVSGSLATSQQTDAANTFKSMATNRVSFTIGTKIPASGKAEDWMQQAIAEPMPVSATLTPIPQYLTASKFPKDKLIAQKRAALEKALSRYCPDFLLRRGAVNNCNAPSKYKIKVAVEPPKYFIVPGKMANADAERECQKRNATFAMMKSSGDNMEAKEVFLASGMKHAWVGLVEVDNFGWKWQWIDGTPVGFQAWKAGEPSRDHDEHCGAFHQWDNQVGWADFPCQWNELSVNDREWNYNKYPIGALCQRKEASVATC